MLRMIIENTGIGTTVSRISELGPERKTFLEITILYFGHKELE